MIIFSNTTPIIALASINKLNLLPDCVCEMQKNGIRYNMKLVEKLALHVGEQM